MCPQKTALFAVLGTILFLFSGFTEVDSSGLFELQIRSFRNDQGLTSAGTCCSGIRRNGNCTETCHTFFKVCLSHYQANIATNPNPKCTFANFTSPVLGDNNMEFSRVSDLSQQSRQNTFYFPVVDFSWPGDFSLIIEAWHDTGLDSSLPDHRDLLISRLAMIKTATAGEEWAKDVFNHNYKELQYAYRFTCDEFYYGANCADMCRNRDDTFGHYSCSDNGTRVCLDGWKGDYCDQAICLSGCSLEYGYCDVPYECKCDTGWEGNFCKDCIRYPGCQKGTCDEPWDCKCMDGWGGMMCNQDLNFCTRHKPCHNGGLCQNTGQGSYTCFCAGSYTGVNCESEIDDCENKPCHNDGVCTDIGNEFQCKCPQGFYGRHCQYEARSCKTNPCLDGGTCVDQEDSYYCLCEPGFTGANCEVQINECHSNPCQNGRCIDQRNGYRCVCNTGFSGTDCETNNDDCHHNPCLNSGQCLDRVNEFECRCRPGFVGSLCQDNVDDCEMRPCANGGRCKDLVNDFQCMCAPGFEGKDCSQQIDECQPDPCVNNGICTDLLADYRCSCPDGFWGKNCQKYEGYTSPNDNALTRELTTVKPIRTTPNNTDKGGQISPHEGDDEEEEEVGLTMTQLLIIVCLGVGIPLILIIIAVIFLLCRKRSCIHRQRPARSLGNMSKEKEQNYINNMNNKSSGDIFTTPLPSSASNSSSIKISNEEQQDINKLKAKQFFMAGGDDGGGTSSSGAGRIHTSSSKQFLREATAAVHHTHYELPPSSSSCAVPASLSFPPSSSSSSSSAIPSSSKGGRRGSDCDFEYDYEKPYRKLDVDSLHVDVRRPVSVHTEFQHRHSREPQLGVVKLPDFDLDPCDSGALEHAHKDNIHSSVYQDYSNTSSPQEAPRSTILLQHQQQQQQQPQEHFKPTRPATIYNSEDYWATEV